MGTGIPAAALLLADGRFPSGGHVHSAGVEAAVGDGRIADEESLEAYLRGRVVTAGRTEAALAAATVVRVRTVQPGRLSRILEVLDEHATARCAPPPLREASRRQGRALHRAASRCWPSAVLAALEAARPSGAQLPVAWGAVAVAAGLDAATVACLVLHHAVTTPAQAAVRLLGLDPFAVAALSGRVLDGAKGVLSDALEAAAGPLEELPAWTSPLVEIAAMAHARADGRLFAT